MFCKYAFMGNLFTAFIVKNINLGIIVVFFFFGMEKKLHSLTFQYPEKVYLKSASYKSCVILHLPLVPVSLTLYEHEERWCHQQKGKIGDCSNYIRRYLYIARRDLGQILGVRHN